MGGESPRLRQWRAAIHKWRHHAGRQQYNDRHNWPRRCRVKRNWGSRAKAKAVMPNSPPGKAS